MTESNSLKHYIAGEFISVTDSTFESRNPSNSDDLVAIVPIGNLEHLNQACNAAQHAFVGWRSLTGGTRAEYLYSWAASIQARAEELAQAVCREVGKPIGEARGEVGRAVALLRYYAGEAVREVGDVIPAQVQNSVQYTFRQPLGPVAMITPWNFPLAIPIWKIAPALAFGNTVILKPAESSSFCANLLAETAHAAKFPNGVINVLFGLGSTVGSALISHEAIKGVTFTGSASVGAKVAQGCVARNIKFQTEMGGKNVGIVLQDADISLAARMIASGAMRYAGQKCTATSRAIVDKSVKAEFMAKLIDEVNKLPLGPVTEPTSAIGPLISHESVERVMQAIRSSDAKLVLGGQRPEGEFSKGNFVTPTVFENVDPDSSLATDEIFGPVLAVIVADGFEQAIELANKSQYGLSAALYTRDLANAFKYVDQIEAGMVRVNGDTTGVDPHAPFGGMKGSSSHSREQGNAARDFFTEIKTVQISHG